MDAWFVVSGAVIGALWLLYVILAVWPRLYPVVDRFSIPLFSVLWAWCVMALLHVNGIV